MIEIKGNLFDYPKKENEAICITTNAILKLCTEARLGVEAVMGAGVALTAEQRYPGLSIQLGETLLTKGHHVQTLRKHATEHYQYPMIISFPTKIHWRSNSPLWLIERSIIELDQFADDEELEKVYLPRPGCGLGGLRWPDIRSLFEELDDRFVVVSLKGQI